MILEDVVEEHAEEAAFLWQQREMAVRAPDFDLSEVIEWDERLEAHLDGLRIAGEAGWHIGKEIGWDLPGEFFTAMAQAIHHGKAEWIKEVLDAAEDDAAATRGVISAFGWAPRKNLQGVVKQLLATRSAFGRQVGIGACAVHRVNPGPPLVQALSSHHAGEKARAAKAAGELGLADLREPLEQSLGDEDPEVRFWSTWSACLLGSAAARPGLEGFANTEGPRQRQALELLMRLLPADAGKTWLRTHFAGQENLRFALIGAGLHGDPFYLEPLIKQFSREEVARVAGEAFEMITGLNLFQRSFEILDPVEITAPVEAEDLEGLDEEALDALDEDDDNEEEALEEDIGLVRPDPAKVQPWFMEHRADFPSGERFLCGHPISLDHCEQVLRDGRQRQRRAAALEVALAKPGTALFEVRAPGLRQATALRSS